MFAWKDRRIDGSAFDRLLDLGLPVFFEACEVIEESVATITVPLAHELSELWADANALVKGRSQPEHPPPGSSPMSSTRAFNLRVFQEIFVGTEQKALSRDLDEANSHMSSPAYTDEEQESAFRVVVGSGTFALSVLGALHQPGLWVLSAVGLLYQIAPIFRDAYHALVHEGRISFYVLNSLLIVLATLSGSYVAVTGSVVAVSLLRWLTAKTEGVAQRSLASVFARQPSSVWVFDPELKLEVQVPFDRVKVGDTIVIGAGHMIPVDGLITKGVASIDQRMLTGEAQAVDRGPGDRVLASTLVLRGRLHIQVTHSGKDTLAAQVATVLSDTSKYKRELKARTDQRLDSLSVPYLALSALTLPIWGLNSAAAVLRSSPAYRMMFFGPLTMLSFLHAASRRGILIKNGRALERLREVDTFVFDKTGTLTLEQLTVGRLFCFSDLAEQEVLSLAATAERGQSHPIARAIQARAIQEHALLQTDTAHNITAQPEDDTRASLGFGMSVMLEGHQILLGSERLMSLHDVDLTPEALHQQQGVHSSGNSIVFLARDRELVGAIELRPTLRPEASTLIPELQRRGKKVIILSGDQEAPTRSLAQQLGADRHYSQVLPDEKSKVIERLRAEGRGVCFVGDGINDSLALQQADVSISMKGATSLATNVAQVVLMNGNLELLLPLLDMSERFEDYMRVNRLAAAIPAYITLGGSLLLGWGFATAVVLSQISTPLAVYCLVGPASEFHTLDQRTPPLPVPRSSGASASRIEE